MHFNVFFLIVMTDHCVFHPENTCPLRCCEKLLKHIKASCVFSFKDLCQLCMDIHLLNPLNMNLGRISLPKAVLLFIKDKNNWILVMQRTNISQPGRCWVFSHAGEVEGLSL